MSRLFLLFLLGISVPSVGLAQEAYDPTAINRLLAPLLVAAGIAYVTRRAPLGGWAGYWYFSSVIGGTFVTVMLAIPSLKHLFSGGWEPFYWWMAFLDYVPGLLAKLASIVLAVMILFRRFRNPRFLLYIRISLLAILVFSLDGWYFARHFPDDPSNVLTGFAILSAAIWAGFWMLSRRVKYVFHLDGKPFVYDEFRAWVQNKNTGKNVGTS